MRFILAILLLVAGGSFVLWRYPEFMPVNLEAVSEQAGKLLSEKQIQVSGLEVLTRADIMQHLPLGKSVLWWQSHSQEIETMLETNALIQDASVSACPGSDLRCFEVRILERHPTFVAALGDRVWLIGEDGGFITPVPKKQFDQHGTNLIPGRPALILVEGLLGELTSPDVAKARIRYVRSIIEHVEPEAGLKVRSVEMRPNGETALRFHGLDLRAIFDSVSERPERAREEARRLKAILKQYGRRAADIERIDLAFEKVAITKLKQN